MKAYIKRVLKAILNIPAYPQEGVRTIYSAEKTYVISQSISPKLAGKVALVTGGTGTLGRSVALMLALEGATVYIGGRNEERIRTVMDEIYRLGGCGHAAQFNINDAEAIEKMINNIYENEKHLDILVNCAGGSARDKMKDLVQQDIAVIETVLDTNLRSTILCSKYVGQKMIKQKYGKIINIASTTGIQGNTGNCDYTAAKSGVIGFTKALAQELGPYNINVNCVSPGYIQTGEYTDERIDYLKRTNYLRAVGTPEDIANGVVFLVSDHAKFVTGINLVIDGGRILGLHTFNS